MLMCSAFPTALGSRAWALYPCSCAMTAVTSSISSEETAVISSISSEEHPVGRRSSCAVLEWGLCRCNVGLFVHEADGYNGIPRAASSEPWLRFCQQIVNLLTRLLNWNGVDSGLGRSQAHVGCMDVHVTAFVLHSSVVNSVQDLNCWRDGLYGLYCWSCRQTRQYYYASCTTLQGNKKWTLR